MNIHVTKLGTVKKYKLHITKYSGLSHLYSTERNVFVLIFNIVIYIKTVDTLTWSIFSHIMIFGIS